MAVSPLVPCPLQKVHSNRQADLLFGPALYQITLVLTRIQLALATLTLTPPSGMLFSCAGPWYTLGTAAVPKRSAATSSASALADGACVELLPFKRGCCCPSAAACSCSSPLNCCLRRDVGLTMPAWCQQGAAVVVVLLRGHCGSRMNLLNVHGSLRGWVV
jgi:hypothetical protein